MSAQSSSFALRETGSARAGPLVIVDDNREEAELTKHLVESSRSDRRVLILNSGETLEAYLRGEGFYSDRAKYPIPSVILLDLKMPGMDGFHVLEWIGAQPEYSSIPVIVVSGFGELSNLKRAYSLRARAYLLKPVNLDSLRGVLWSLNITL